MIKELTISIEGRPDLTVTLSDPISQGTKLLGVVSSREEIAMATQSLRLVHRVVKARQDCQYNMLVPTGSPWSLMCGVAFTSMTHCGAFVCNHFKGKLFEHFILFEHQQRSRKMMRRVMAKFAEEFGRAFVWSMMNEEERSISLGNRMVEILKPGELERWADAEEQEQEAKAKIVALRKKVGSRDLSGWCDEENPEAEAILNQLPAGDREFARLCYPEELDQYITALDREREASKTKADLLRLGSDRAK